MLKRNITFTDFNDKEVTETLYFNLSKSEMIEMEMMAEGGFAESLQRIVEAKDVAKLIVEFKKIILASYGEKSDDGKRFIKNEKLREEFSQTAAYNALFMELATDDNAATEFITGVLPKDIVTAVPSIGVVDVKDPAFEAMKAASISTTEQSTTPSPYST